MRKPTQLDFIKLERQYGTGALEERPIEAGTFLQWLLSDSQLDFEEWAETMTPEAMQLLGEELTELLAPLAPESSEPQSGTGSQVSPDTGG